MSILLSIFGLIAAIQVITAVNPVHSVFFLVLVFTITSVMRLLISMEFMALVFLMVYVGAIAVLFLFVVMMLNVQPDYKERPLGNIPMMVGVGILFMFFMWSSVFSDMNFTYQLPKQYVSFEIVNQMDRMTNRTTIGQVLYTKYCVEFLMAGIVLLVSMIGAVLLTLSTGVEGKTNVTPALRQQVHQQHSRDAQRAIFKIH